jgi:hypothetical protein
MSHLSQSRNPAYHLRPNKAVDRLLFLELIRTLELRYSLARHSYIGFAGPFIEDFRIIAQAFPKLKMISVESDSEIIKRQKFHLCSRRMTLCEGYFKEFLATSYPTDSPTITWTDYTDMKRDCLLEISDIARKSVPRSMLRVTVRAETPLYKALHLYHRPLSLPFQKKKEFEAFSADFERNMRVEGVAYDDSLFVWDNFREKEYPTLIRKMIISVIEASCTHPKRFLPIHSVKYSDGTIMLSVTGIFCLDEELKELQSHFRRSGLSNYKYNGQEEERIDVPVLTIKERLHLEPHLPSKDETGKTCHGLLGYSVEGNGEDTLSMYKMQQYEKYYRFFPYFGKLIP